MPFESTKVCHTFSVFADGLDLEYSPRVLEKLAIMPSHFFELWGEGCLLQPLLYRRNGSEVYNGMTLYVYTVASPSDVVDGTPSAKYASRLSEIYGWIMGYLHEYLV